MTQMTKEEMWQAVVKAVTDVLDDQGQSPGPMTPQTALGRDLGVSSVDTIHFLLALEDRFEMPLDFEKLALSNGEYRTDLTLGELWEFVVARTSETGTSTASAS
jgi:acyl carrier protein